jgi:hypothetical protein
MGKVGLAWDHGSPGRRATAPVLGTSPVSRRGEAAWLIEIQRQAGNQAVVELVRQLRAAPPPVISPPLGRLRYRDTVIQRQRRRGDTGDLNIDFLLEASHRAWQQASAKGDVGAMERITASVRRWLAPYEVMSGKRMATQTPREPKTEGEAGETRIGPMSAEGSHALGAARRGYRHVPWAQGREERIIRDLATSPAEREVAYYERTRRAVTTPLGGLAYTVAIKLGVDRDRAGEWAILGKLVSDMTSARGIKNQITSHQTAVANRPTTRPAIVGDGGRLGSRYLPPRSFAERLQEASTAKEAGRVLRNELNILRQLGDSAKAQGR